MIKNTFAPHVTNKELTIPQILMGLQFGVFKYEQLPQEAKDGVNKIKPRMDDDDDDDYV